MSAAGAYRDLLCMGLFSNFFGLLGQQRPHFGRTKPNCSAGRRLPDRIEDTTFCNSSRALTTDPAVPRMTAQMSVRIARKALTGKSPNSFVPAMLRPLLRSWEQSFRPPHP
jgi:hypothetical protein